MRIGLVDCGLNVVVGDTYNMPFGLLSIAGIAEEQGHTVELLQLSQLCSPRSHLDDRMARLVALIGEGHYDLLGFTSRCDTLPVVVEVAKRCKERRPDTPIVLGGPGATFVDRPLLEAYPFIDTIVRGEGEITFAELLSAWGGNKPWREIEGISYRANGEGIVINERRATLCDLDRLPPMPLHLVHDVLGNPELVRTDVLIGRGCPNGCRFCSTCAFWGRKTRTRSVENVIAEMRILHDRYDFDHFNLVDDNLFGYRNLLPDLCHAIQKYLPHVKYYVYVSMNFATPELVELLARTGCTGAFVGLETGSARLASHLRAKFCLPETVHQRLDLFRKNNVHLTKSFIIGFPDEETDDRNKTLLLAIEAQATAPVAFTEMVQMHPLGIHPGTELYDQYGDRLRFSPNKQTSFNIANLTATDSIRSHCVQHPKIFTAYASYMHEADYAALAELCESCQLFTLYYPKSLFVLLTELQITPTAFIEYFQDYLRLRQAESAAEEEGTVFDGRFRYVYLREFASVAERLYREKGVSPETLWSMWEAESPRAQVCLGRYEHVNLCPRSVFNSGSFEEQVPFVPRTTLVRSFAYDPDVVFARFRRGDGTAAADTGAPLELAYFLPRHFIMQTLLTSMPCYNIMRLDALNKYIIRDVDGVSTGAQIACRIEGIMDPAQRETCRKVVQARLRALTLVGVLLLSGECF
jgi:radical SAM superfamily enzyme YgiQ (UPF0313 family)